MKHMCHLLDDDYESMSMSSLSLQSDQHEACLFEYVVKMSHTEQSQKTSSHVLPVPFRTCVHPHIDLPRKQPEDGAIGRNMRAAPMHPGMSADGSTTASPEEEKYKHQNMILRERLRLAQRRQLQQHQMQVALQGMLSKTYLKKDGCVKAGRRRDSALVQQPLDGSFPLACTTILARRCSMTHSIR